MTFKNEAQLKKFLIGKCANAVANVERKVHTEFAGNLNQYYSEFSPEEYIRTGALFNSLETTGTHANGSGASAEIYFNTPSYQTGVVPLQHTPEHGIYGYATWNGQKVLDTAMHGSHGGYVGGTAIWDESMASLGDINALLLSELKKQGLQLQ